MTARIVSEEEVKAMKEDRQAELQAVYDSMQMKADAFAGIAELKMPQVLANSIDNYETAVPLDELKKLNEDLLKRHEGFNGFKRLNREYKRRIDILEEGTKTECGEGEAV